MKRVLLLALCAGLSLAALTTPATKPAPQPKPRPQATPARPLPLLGTTFQSLPAGKGKTEVEAACYRCHSADLLVQQRLTEKQWTAAVEKMMRWGAVVSESDKAVMIAYLSKHFGPENQRFRPIRTQVVR
jgi:cytochrome c1